MHDSKNTLEFQEAISKIEERGGFNRFAESKPVFENRLKELKPGDYTERGICYYYLLTSYLKAHLVHETEESIEFYESMDKAFMKQKEVYEKEPKKFSWGEIQDFFRLMERCYGSLEILYHQHDFRTRRRESYERKMQFRKAGCFFRREYWHWFIYKFTEVTSRYGNSLVRWAITTAMFTLVMAAAFWLNDHFLEESLRTVPSDAHLYDYIYFSMITLTTVGFGDITPISLGAKILSTIEAFLGFLMLGIFIGLIQKRL